MGSTDLFLVRQPVGLLHQDCGDAGVEAGSDVLQGLQDGDEQLGVLRPLPALLLLNSDLGDGRQLGLGQLTQVGEAEPGQRADPGQLPYLYAFPSSISKFSTSSTLSIQLVKSPGRPSACHAYHMVSGTDRGVS